MKSNSINQYDKINYGLLILYIIFIPFTSALAITSTISPPLIMASGIFLFMIYGGLIGRPLPNMFLDKDIIFIIFFLLEVSFTFFINGWNNLRALNHTIAYHAFFLLFYVGIKYSIFSISHNNNVFIVLLKTTTIVTILCAFFGCFEFVSYNLFNLNLNDYIPRATEEESFYDATVLEFFFRSRGFASESGHFTFMMELFSPMAIYFIYFSDICKWNKIFKASSLILIVFCFIFSASTTSFIINPISIIIVLFINYNKTLSYFKKNIQKVILFVIIFLLFVFLLEYFISLYSFIQLSVFGKFESGAYDYRSELNSFFFEYYPKLSFINQLIGVGPSGFRLLGFDEYHNILCLYYSIAFELGIVGLLFFLLFLSFILANVIKIKNSFGYFLQISFFSGLMHYYVIANFWYPWFWFICVCIIFYKKSILHGK